MSRRGFQLKTCMDETSALFHADEPQSTLAAHRLAIETGPVVLYREGQMGIVTVQPDLDSATTGMSRDVSQGLLSDAVERAGDLRGNLGGNAGSAEFHGDRRSPGKLAGVG